MVVVKLPRPKLSGCLLITVVSFLLIAPSSSQASLSTQGNKIINAGGNQVVLQGVNWFGFETANHAPHGLWARDYKEMLAQIKEQGFNTIRMPFSIEALQSSTTSGIDYGGGRNAALLGKTPPQVMDIIITEAGRQGLMIILDNHSSTDDSFMSPLWYGVGGYSEADWVNNWKALSVRYANTPNVIGADLKNEPHGEATWGTGAANDWRRAAELAGNAVLESAPNWLIFVEGIEGPVAGGQQLDRHWWGGNLEGVRNNPVRLSVANRLVYSPHEYGPGVFAQTWFSDPNMESILADRWQKGFGYIHDANIAPILIGEFGARNVGADTVEGHWIRQFADYLGSKGINWTFWAWNPNSGDTGGVLQDDWKTINTAKMGLLAELMGRKPQAYDPGDGSTPSYGPVPGDGAVDDSVPGDGTGNNPSPKSPQPKIERPVLPQVVWKSNKRSNRVVVIIEPASGVTYSLTAARGKSRRSAGCRSVKLKIKQMMRCSIKLTNGRWKLSAVAKTAAGRSSKSKVFRL